MTLAVTIRPEQPFDTAAIERLTIAAFATAPHPDHCEQFVIRALREHDALAVSLVAEFKQMIVGHVAASPVCINGVFSACYGLGPLSVVPEYQHQVIGSLLMAAVLQALTDLGAQACVLLGEPSYYRRFGFAPEPGLSLAGAPPEYFQALRIGESLPQGAVRYHNAFNAKCWLSRHTFAFESI